MTESYDKLKAQREQIEERQRSELERDRDQWKARTEAAEKVCVAAEKWLATTSSAQALWKQIRLEESITEWRALLSSKTATQ